MLYFQASLRFIATILAWVNTHDPGRTEPVTWEEVLSNVDHNADLGNPDAIEMIVTDYFADRPEWAMSTFRCESGLRPWAYNPAGPYVGIAQVYRGADTVRWNIEQARSIYDRQGPGAWPVCGR